MVVVRQEICFGNNVVASNEDTGLAVVKTRAAHDGSSVIAATRIAGNPRTIVIDGPTIDHQIVTVAWPEQLNAVLFIPDNCTAIYPDGSVAAPCAALP
jgi:hypothetical protein